MTSSYFSFARRADEVKRGEINESQIKKKGPDEPEKPENQ
jgi:hypothetical protein